MSDVASPVSPGRILVVEDEPEVCAFLADELTQAGYEVTCAGNDQAAYAALEEDWRSFSAVILDINLGRGTTGFDVARFTRGLDARMPVIFTTGYAAENSIERYGVANSAFVAKPFTGQEMLEAIRAVMDARPPAG